MLKKIMYEERMISYFRKKIAEHEEQLSRITGYCNTVEIEERCSELGEIISYYSKCCETCNTPCTLGNTRSGIYLRYVRQY